MAHLYSESNNTLSVATISNSLANDALSNADNHESTRSLDTVTMLNRLYELCERATGNDPVSWDSIRACLASMSPEEAQSAGEQLGEFASCPLHLICRNTPPVDVVESLLRVAPDVVEWADIFGWLPLHYACANGASYEVIHMLIEACPHSTITADKKGRTPLHFGLNLQKPASADSIRELASAAGAAKLPDENAMLPLHYACAYGATEEVLRVLLFAYRDSIKWRDKKGRIPLHFVLSNADRPSSPAAVMNLLMLNPETVNFRDKEGGLPLHLLNIKAKSIPSDRTDERENLTKCLRYYLNARPYANAEFLSALQSLPEWLRDVVVLIPTIQQNLNQKISKRFPTSILMLDFYFLMLIVIFFTLGIHKSLDIRSAASEKNEVPSYIIIILYACGGYFIIREVIQIIALWSLGLFKAWLKSPTNWLDVTMIALLLLFTYIMANEVSSSSPSYIPIEDDYDSFFRVGATFSIGIFWASLLSYIKNVNIEFAVFVNGVFYVLKNLAAFLIAAVIFLLAFAQIFLTIFVQTDHCKLLGEDEFFFCNLHDSFVQSLTYMLGQLDDTLFWDSPVNTLFFVSFVFLVIIVLTTILIAIVTDNYSVIQRERAAIVFWNNRLDFVAEVDAVMSGPWRKRVLSMILPFDDELEDDRYGLDDVQTNPNQDYETFGRDIWMRIISVFEDENLQVLTIDFLAYTVLRVLTALFIIFVVFPLGLITAGWLWPPQIREYLFIKSMASIATSSEQQSTSPTLDDTINRKIAIQALVKEVEDLKENVKLKVMSNRNEIIELKCQLQEIQDELVNEIKLMKEVVLTLYERQTGENVENDDDAEVEPEQ